MRTSPETLDSKRWGTQGRLLKLSDQPDPDSYYAVSKLNGENLGRLYARLHGLQVICARIGWIVVEDDPRKSPWVANDDNKEYMRAMHLSHRDCDEIFHRCVSRALPPDTGHGQGQFALVYAVSNNTRRVFDLAESARILDYVPRDDVEKLVAQDWAHIGA